MYKHGVSELNVTTICRIIATSFSTYVYIVHPSSNEWKDSLDRGTLKKCENCYERGRIEKQAKKYSAVRNEKRRRLGVSVHFTGFMCKSKVYLYTH